MSPILIGAVICTVLALVFYTLAAWKIFRSSIKKSSPLPILWLGFLFDLSGTIGMAIIAGGIHISGHGMYGYTALLIMFAICLWFTRLSPTSDFTLFRRASLIAWIIWLGSFISGMMQGMG